MTLRLCSLLAWGCTKQLCRTEGLLMFPPHADYNCTWSHLSSRNIIQTSLALLSKDYIEVKKRWWDGQHVNPNMPGNLNKSSNITFRIRFNTWSLWQATMFWICSICLKLGYSMFYLTWILKSRHAIHHFSILVFGWPFLASKWHWE